MTLFVETLNLSCASTMPFRIAENPRGMSDSRHPESALQNCLPCRNL